MPLARRQPIATQPFGDPAIAGVIASASYSGSGSVVIVPLASGRFGNTNAFNFSDRAIGFYRFVVPKTTTFSGLCLAFTANTASSKSVTSITESSGTATATATAHGFSVGDRIRITGATPTAYNATFLVATVPTANTFTFSIATGTGSASGTILAREFIGGAVYSSSQTDLTPLTKLADVAFLPSTSAVTQAFDSNLTLNAGHYWLAIGGSRKTNNTTLATFVSTDNNSTVVNTYLYGMKTGDFSQYRGGVGILAMDNFDTSVGNSGFPTTITNMIIQSNQSAGSTHVSVIVMVGIVVA